MLLVDGVEDFTHSRKKTAHQFRKGSKKKKGLRWERESVKALQQMSQKKKTYHLFIKVIKKKKA